MASSRYEVEVTVASARDLKNVNWRNGDLRPYAVLWIDNGPKCSTTVAFDGDTTAPVFDAKLTVPLPLPPSSNRIDDSVLHVDIVHARSDSDDADVKPLVGSAEVPLRDVLDEVGVGGKAERKLKLKRPSGRPQGKVEVKVAVREPHRYYDPYAAPSPYGQPAAPYGPPPVYGGYGGGQPPVYGGGQPPYGYGGQPPYGAAPPAGYPYGGSSYGAPPYGGGGYGGEDVSKKKKKSGMGMGTGLAVGAAAGVLGGLALAEGVDYVEDKIEDDLGYDDF